MWWYDRSAITEGAPHPRSDHFCPRETSIFFGGWMKALRRWETKNRAQGWCPTNSQQLYPWPSDPVSVHPIQLVNSLRGEKRQQLMPGHPTVSGFLVWWSTTAGGCRTTKQSGRSLAVDWVGWSRGSGLSQTIWASCQEKSMGQQGLWYQEWQAAWHQKACQSPTTNRQHPYAV